MSRPLFDVLELERSYREATEHYRYEIPDNFNFAYDVIDRQAAENDKTAIIAVSGDGANIRKISYAQMAESSNRFANGLMKLGAKSGDFACLVVGRIPQWYDAIFGCMKAGVVSMPGTTLLTGKDISYRVNHSKASIVIVSPEHCDKVDAVRHECPSLTHFIVIGEARDGWVSSVDMCENSPDEIASRVQTSSIDMMMAYFTSGTTAMPKMVPRDYAYGLAHAATAMFWMDLKSSDIHWTLTDTGWAESGLGNVVSAVSNRRRSCAL